MLKRQQKKQAQLLIDCGETNNQADFMDGAKDWHKAKIEKRQKQRQHTSSAKKVSKTFKGGHKPKRKNPKHGLSAAERNQPRDEVLRAARKAQQAIRERATLMRRLDAIVGPTVIEQALVCSNTDLLNPGPSSRHVRVQLSKMAAKEPVRIEAITPLKPKVEKAAAAAAAAAPVKADARAGYVKKSQRKKHKPTAVEIAESHCTFAPAENDMEAFIVEEPVATQSAVAVNSTAKSVESPMPANNPRVDDARSTQLKPEVPLEVGLEVVTKPFVVRHIKAAQLQPAVVQRPAVPLPAPVRPALPLAVANVPEPVEILPPLRQHFELVEDRFNWSIPIPTFFFWALVVCYVPLPFCPAYIDNVVARMFIILAVFFIGHLWRLCTKAPSVAKAVASYCSEWLKCEPQVDMPKEVPVLEGRILCREEVRGLIAPKCCNKYSHQVTVVPVGSDDRIINDLGMPAVSRPYELAAIFYKPNKPICWSYWVYFMPIKLLICLFVIINTIAVMNAAFGPTSIGQHCELVEHEECGNVCAYPHANGTINFTYAYGGRPLTADEIARPSPLNYSQPYCTWGCWRTTDVDPVKACWFYYEPRQSGPIFDALFNVIIWYIAQLAWEAIHMLWNWYFPYFRQVSSLSLRGCKVLYYVPHLVSAVLRDYSLDADHNKSGRTIRQRLLCCPTFPLSARDSAQILDGTELVIEYLLKNRNFTLPAGFGPWDGYFNRPAGKTTFQRGATGQVKSTCPASVLQQCRKENQFGQPHTCKYGPRTLKPYLTARYQALDQYLQTELIQLHKPKPATKGS